MIKSLLTITRHVTDYRKNAVYNFSQIEIKVREATSNKNACDPSPPLMREIARYTFDR